MLYRIFTILVSNLPTMLNRRTFIKQSAVSSGGIVLAHPLFGFNLSQTKTDVIIIGAGLAGLAAALKLKKRNISYIIVEAQSRIGGRVFSHQIDPELVIELGGEWIGDSHVRMQELCADFGLELQDNRFDSHLIYKENYFANGQWNYSAEWNKKFEQLVENYHNMNEAEQLQLDQYDWWRYLVNNGCKGRDLEIRELLDSTDFGESIRHVSAFAALAEYAESSPYNEMDLKIKGGNSMLAQKMADAVGRENIFLNHPVTKIDQTQGVKVACANGLELTANKVICTIPTFAISKIDWFPKLPEEKINAINELQYSRINKHAVLFDNRFWKAENFDLVTDQLPHYFYHATKNQISEKGVLISYSVGDKAAVIANQSDEWNANQISNTLSPHFGNIKNRIEKQVNYYWGEDQYTKGAYALYGAGQWFRVMPILQKSFLNTLFAGEYIADWQGFMEGAVNTGEDAADAV